MRSAASVNGHPIHPMLIPFPFAFLTGAFLFDAAARWFRKPEYGQTGRHLTAAGIGAGLLAAVPGVIDYFGSVPPNSSASERATRHAIANVTGLALFGLSLAARRGNRPTGPTLTAQAAAVGVMSYAGYLGGTLVYRNQIGVDHRYADAGKWQEVPAKGAVVPGGAGDLGVNQMKLVHADGHRIAVGRTEKGLAAFDDRCTHKGGPLSDGVLICGTVQCPWHGSQFDVETGAVKCGPARENIRTHALIEDGARLRITE
jgi:uncharacterized membrane protein/nitrite reductase/ring-hydroxylating ferredoxin subunit